ncbi:Similar to Npc1b: NPC intracellular cholesterol transporter 1 homolog 1b (Drosophila melanogaster) [Cotesia congregata]|uniref:Similar to Npc1b: NPC intracellular cholesterol transporter 1 homolog 1b (Drosophila melanogaster) n=1 Tax=Cotesia congregata TaxID=51543 RepID=A0A8J2MP54_COTCN|nr:Similar to Npc1b: NPC intracellular cholesterol transporter 1 homolog 1b (Drosophila melanogaster) [Cotesia congregata]
MVFCKIKSLERISLSDPALATKALDRVRIRLCSAQEIQTSSNLKSVLPTVVAHDLKEYINATFDSCRGVLFPATGGSAFDMACGDYGLSRCTPKRWYTFMGEMSKLFGGFQITYVYEPDQEKNLTEPLNSPTKSCSEAYENSTACGCVDCVCKNIIEWKKEDSVFTILELNGYGIVVGILIIIISTIFTLNQIFFKKFWASISVEVINSFIYSEQIILG